MALALTRAWALNMIGFQAGPRNSSERVQCRMSVFRDKGLAKLCAQNWGSDACIQRVQAKVTRLTKNDGAWRIPDDPEDPLPLPGIYPTRLAKILARRVRYGGPKGRRAEKRIQWLKRNRRIRST